MPKLLSRLVVGVFLGTASHQVLAQSASWTVSEARGPVTIERAQGRQAATSGAVVQPGDAIVTGAGGRAVLVQQKDFVTVAANSRIRIPRQAGESGLTRFFQEIGNAVFNVEKRGTPRFSVDTPFLAAVVKGTVFSVSVKADSSALQVTEGVVEVATTDGGARELVRPGSIALITAGDRHRLIISGDRAATIDSPARSNAPVVAPAVPAQSPAGASEETPVESRPDPTGGETVTVRMDEAVVSKPVDLAKATNGILTGMSPVPMVAAFALISTVAEKTVRDPVPTGATDAGRSEVASDTSKSDATPAQEKPVTAKPEDTSGSGKSEDKPDADKSGGGQPGPGQPEGKPNEGKSDKDKSEGKPDGGKANDGKRADKPDGGKPEEGKSDGAKADDGKSDAGKDKGKADQGKPDDDKSDEGKPDGKSDQGKADEGKPESKSDEAKPDKEKPEGKPDDGKPEGKSDEAKPDKDKPEGKPDDGKPEGKSDEAKPDKDKPEGKPDDGKPDGKSDEAKPDKDKPEGKPEGKSGGG